MLLNRFNRSLETANLKVCLSGCQSLFLKGYATDSKSFCFFLFLCCISLLSLTVLCKSKYEHSLGVWQHTQSPIWLWTQVYICMNGLLLNLDKYSRWWWGGGRGWSVAQIFWYGPRSWWDSNLLLLSLSHLSSALPRGVYVWFFYFCYGYYAPNVISIHFLLPLPNPGIPWALSNTGQFLCSFLQTLSTDRPLNVVGLSANHTQSSVT